MVNSLQHKGNVDSTPHFIGQSPVLQGITMQLVLIFLLTRSILPPVGYDMNFLEYFHNTQCATLPLCNAGFTSKETYPMA